MIVIVRLPAFNISLLHVHVFLSELTLPVPALKLFVPFALSVYSVELPSKLNVTFVAATFVVAVYVNLSSVVPLVLFALAFIVIAVGAGVGVVGAGVVGVGVTGMGGGGVAVFLCVYDAVADQSDFCPDEFTARTRNEYVDPSTILSGVYEVAVLVL